MKIQVDGKEFTLEFRHNFKGDANLGSTCSIKPEGGEEVVGVAKLHPKDQACRMKGRKYALKRALAFPEFSKDFRTKFWKAYFQATNFTNAL